MATRTGEPNLQASPVSPVYPQITHHANAVIEIAFRAVDGYDVRESAD